MSISNECKVNKGSVIGGMLLITGSCIGAGMLALPILTGIAGLIPSFLMFLLAWIFMTTTALLLVEVNSWFGKPVNLISMVGHSLGKWGKVLCWILYLFLFYALLVAYTSLSGNHVSSFFGHVLSINLPDYIGSIFFVLLFGGFVYLGTKPVDHLNRLLMFGKIFAFAFLVLLGLQFIKPVNLVHTQVKYIFFSLPILVISFGFHNMIPCLCTYLDNDMKRVKKSIWGGSLLTLFIYIIWEVVAIGVLPVKGTHGIMESFMQDVDAAQAIRDYLGSNLVGGFAQVLAFFAILTSFLAQSLSVVHFLGDGLKIKRKKRESIMLCVIALAPPLIFSVINPNLFFQALGFAGGICAVILFGVFPALMAWIGRYHKKLTSDTQVIGGKLLLIGVFSFAVFIFFYQITQTFGLSIFPKP